ncbi:hypothetical protein Ae201684P_022476 [Aphanomyces euteiches]|nr:hypothetical protein Ae201684P_022476 [Aphanomyces euteiches]
MNPTYSLSNPECIGVNFQRNDGDIHVLVVVPGAGLLEHPVSHSKHLHYKGMSVEASCRKYLDAIAKQISLTYDFPQRFTQSPTIGDVFQAVDNGQKEKENKCSTNSAGSAIFKCYLEGIERTESRHKHSNP